MAQLDLSLDPIHRRFDPVSNWTRSRSSQVAMQQVLRNMEYFREYLAYQQRRQQREAHRRRREQRMSRSLPEAVLPPPPPQADTGSESEPDAGGSSRKTRNAARMRRRLSHDISAYQARVRFAYRGGGWCLLCGLYLSTDLSSLLQLTFARPAGEGVF